MYMHEVEKELESIFQEMGLNHINGELKFDCHREAIPVIKLSNLALKIRDLHFSAFEYDDEELFLANDKTVGFKASNLYLLAMIIESMRTHESEEISMILSGLSYRNYTLAKDYPETFYWTVELMIRKHVKDIIIHSDGKKLADNQFDETFAVDFFEKISILISVLDMVNEKEIQLVKNRLIGLLSLCVYSFSVRILHNLPQDHIPKAIEDSVILAHVCKGLITNTETNHRDSMLPSLMICQDSLGELYQAAALYNSGKYLDDQIQIHKFDSPLLANRSITEIVKESYNLFIKCCDIGHKFNNVSLKSMYELKMCNILSLFPDIDHSEFLMLPHSDEHFSRALNNFQQLSDNTSEEICRDWINAKSSSIEGLINFNKSGLNGYPMYFFYEKYIKL